MGKDEARRSVPLLNAVGSDRYNAVQMAEAATLTLEQIRTVLEPILGAQAVAALYRRCLHLCAATDPLFESLCVKEQPAMNTCDVESMLAQQGSMEARCLGDELVSTFHSLLASLIGQELADQLVGEFTASSMRRTDQQSLEK